ncbi:MAG: glutaredoxin [Gammaproteobacteria bacterium]|nr:glutaredoxin [Gammaproteobacteria bacterium]
MVYCKLMINYKSLNMILIYTSNWCGYCTAAKNLLEELKLDYKEINIEEENITRQMLLDLSGGYTVPQIKINDKFIGGYDTLQNLYQNNKLLDLVNEK